MVLWEIQLTLEYLAMDCQVCMLFVHDFLIFTNVNTHKLGFHPFMISNRGREKKR
jgi:hypothetical protein